MYFSGSTFVEEDWRVTVTNTFTNPVDKPLLLDIFFTGDIFALKELKSESEYPSVTATVPDMEPYHKNQVQAVLEFGGVTGVELDTGQSVSIRLVLRRYRSVFGFCLYHVDCSRGTSLEKTLPGTKMKVKCALARRILTPKEDLLQRAYFRCDGDDGAWKWQGKSINFNATTNSTSNEAIDYPECQCK